jgi:hypothetical protein
LEINISPALSGRDCEFDCFQNIEIICEVFELSRVVSCDPAVGFVKMNDTIRFGGSLSGGTLVNRSCRIEKTGIRGYGWG